MQIDVLKTELKYFFGIFYIHELFIKIFIETIHGTMGATFLAPAAPPAPPVAPTGGEETIEKDINFTKKIEFWKFF